VTRVLNTYLYNIGILSTFFGLVLYVLRRKARAEVEVEGLGRIKGQEGFVLVALGLLLMAAASWT
jgi:uncharacterized membrane protein